MSLKTDYKGDILDLTQNDRRCFETIENQDGSVSFNDVTVYEQEGDNFGPLDINATNEEVNRIAENLIANGVDFQFAYNGTDYGYTINGTFYPFKTRHTDTFSPTSRANNLDMGVFHTKRYVDTTGVPNINDETQTISAVYTSGNGLDLGATNRKRYIKTNNLMVIPTATKNITANGNNQDVLNYAKVNVDVHPTPTVGQIRAGMWDTKAQTISFSLSGYTRYVVTITQRRGTGVESISGVSYSNLNVVTNQQSDGAPYYYGVYTFIATSSGTCSVKFKSFNTGDVNWFRPETVNIYGIKS